MAKIAGVTVLGIYTFWEITSKRYSSFTLPSHLSTTLVEYSLARLEVGGKSHLCCIDDTTIKG